MARKAKKKKAGARTEDSGTGLPERKTERFLPFNRLQDDTFEHLCVELVERLPGIQRVETKRTPGVKQFGVDVEGFDAAQVPVVVLSAKVRQTTYAAEIEKWSDDFLKHWDTHWKDKGVRRFVIAVTVPLNDDNLNAALAAEAARFQALGLSYEPWGLQQLTRAMKALSARIEAYFPTGSWREAIGLASSDPGAYALAPARASVPPPAATIETLPPAAARDIATRYGEELAGNLEAALERFREGRHKPLETLITRLKADRVAFDMLSAQVKARLVRAEATLAIARSDAIAARQLLAQAAHFHAPPDRVGEAQVLRLEGKPEAALELLAAPTTPRETELLLALLAEQEGPAAMFARLEDLSPPQSPDILRMCGIAHFLAGRDNDAIQAIDAAVAAAPSNFAALIASAIIRFGVSLSAAAPRQFGSFPNPVHPGLARDDDAAVARRREALALFQRLALNTDWLDSDIALWTAATQLMGKDSEQQGYEALRALVHQNPPPPAAMLWALAFGVRFNTKGAHKKLVQRLETRQGSTLDLAALIALHGSHNRRKAALKDLDRFAAQFSLPADQEQIAYWRSQLSSDAGDATAFRDALAAVRRNRDPGSLLAFLTTSSNAEHLLGGAETLALNGLLERVNDLRAPLLALRTADSTELAARAAIAASDGLGAGAIIDAAAPLYPHGQLPHRMRMLQANAALLRGEVASAVRLLEGAAEGEASDFTHLQIAKLRAGVGDIRGARRVLGRLSPHAVLPSREAIPLIGLLQRDAPDLARSLLEAIAPQELAAAAPIEGYTLAQQLGSDRVASALAPVFYTAARDSDKVLVLNSVDEVLAMMKRQQDQLEHLRKQWLTGQFPIHLVLDQQPRPLLIAVHGRCDADLDFELNWPMLLRAGLPRHPPIALQGKTLRLDITAALLAARLGLLDRLDRLGPVRVPAALPDAMTYLLQAVDANAENQANALESVLGQHAMGRLGVADGDGVGDVPVVFPNDDDEPLEPGFAALVRRAGEASPALQAWLSRYSSRTTGVEEISAQRFILDGSSATALARWNLLDEAVSWGIFVLRRGEEAEVRAWLARCRAETERAATLRMVRDTVAHRLLDGSWHNIAGNPASATEAKKLGDAGPVLRSLLELVQADGADTVTWVEDRAASAAIQVGTSRCVDVFDVLAALQAAGHLTTGERRDAETKLMTFGYGNLPYDLDALLLWVRQAPILADRLVETPELTALRRHFALQMDRLRFANPGIRAPSDDGEQNEARFGARHMHLATRLLPRLFADNTTAMEDLVARAIWIWDNCNVDQTGFLPIQGAPSPAVSHTLVKGSLDGLICSVLQLQMDNPEIERACRERYSAWLFGHVIGHVAQHDPTLGEEVLRDVAASLANLLVVPEQEDTPGLARVGRVLVLRTIDPMPEPWRTRLLAVPVLADKLELSREGTITLREDVSFAATDFYAAVASAYADGGGTLKTVKGVTANVEIQATTLTIILGTDRFVLTDQDLGLAQADAAARRVAYTEVARELDLLPAEVEPFWSELEGRDLHSRFLLINEREVNVYHARLLRLDAELKGARRFEADLLAPPAPAAILHYLRLPPDATMKDLPDAFARVEAELGLFEALKRTAGLPLLYPAVISQRLAAAILALDGGEQGHCPSPLYGLKTALALHDARDPARSRAVGDTLSAIETFGSLFLTILRWLARKVSLDPEWQALPAEMRQALLWLHADLLTAHLAVGKTEPEGTAQLFEKLDRFGVWELLTQADKAVTAVAGFETVISLKVWLAGLLGSALGANGFDDATKARLRVMAGQEHDGEWMPQFIALARPDTPPFGDMGESIAALKDIGVLTTTALADCATPKDLLERLLKEADTHDGGEVCAVLPIFRIDDIAPDTIPTILAVVARFKPLDRYAVNSDTYNMWLSLVGTLYGLQGDEAEFAAMLEPRIAAARALGGEASHDAFDSLAESAFHFALASKGDGPERLKTLLALLDRLGQAAQDFLPSLRRLLSGMISQVPAEQGAPLWDAVLKWRRN